jgi:hypothetical protein
MTTPRKPPDVAGAVSAIRKAKARGRGRKSPVFLWLMARHDELEAAFKENAPSWPALAEYLGQGGILSGDGAMPTATSVQNAWARVRKHVATQRTASARPAPVTRPAPARPASPDPTPADPQPQPQQPSGTGSKADEQIARLKEHWRSQKSKMPDPL